MQVLSSQFVFGASWLSSGLTNPLGLFCLVSMAVSVVLIALLSSAIYRSRAFHIPLRRRLIEIVTSDSGTATVEFALVCPVLLFMALLLAQTTLVMSGNLFVNYAAYMATRAAIVQIPIDRVEEGYESANQFSNSPDSSKYRAIQRAAALALLPVAGQLKQGNDAVTSQLAFGMAKYYQNYGKEPGNWVTKQLEAKANYAMQNTAIALYETEPQADKVVYKELPPEGFTFGPRDPITVRVEHKFSLAFPYVGAAFADGRLPDNAGGGLYTKITASCTLTNEGIIDAFPEIPTIRNPPSGRK